MMIVTNMMIMTIGNGQQWYPIWWFGHGRYDGYDTAMMNDGYYWYYKLMATNDNELINVYNRWFHNGHIDH